jgi:hypothetical protein
MQRPDFLPNGFLRAGQRTRIPDSLSSGNQAGFYFDYIPPTGLDTVRVFASTDLQTAETIRRFVHDARPGAALQTVAAATRGATSEGGALGELRRELTKVVETRGIAAFGDDAPHTAVPQQSQQDWTAASLTLRVGD